MAYGLGMVVYSTVVYGREHSVTVARVAFPKALPSIILRAKSKESVLATHIGDHETLRLEGDFGNYFTLEVKQGQEINTLEIIMPDIMQTLIGYSQREDIEIEGDGLYFIVDGDARNVAAIRQLIESVAHLSGQIIGFVEQTTVSVTDSQPLTASTTG